MSEEGGDDNGANGLMADDIVEKLKLLDYENGFTRHK